VKPPRIYIKDKKFYTSYWIPGRGEVRKSTGLTADIAFKENDPEWWKASIHKDALEKKIEIGVANRAAYRYGQPKFIPDEKIYSIPSLEALIMLYAKQWEDQRDSPFERETRKKYITSINTLHAFNKHLNLLNVTENDAKDLKRWLKEKGYQASTIEGYIRRLRTLWKFAVTQEFVPSNPWKNIFVRVEPKIIIPSNIEDEKKFFCVAFKYDRKVFETAFFQRMTAYRFSDTLLVTNESIRGDTLDIRNVKMKRQEVYPICNALAYLFKQMGAREGKLFSYNNTQKYNIPLKEICSIAGIEQLTSKSFKPNFGQELDEWVISGKDIADRFIAALMHHQIKGDTKMASRHYISHIPRMRQILNEAFDHWHQFIIGLYTDYEGSCEKSGITPTRTSASFVRVI
jgi:hypothetical protein